MIYRSLPRATSYVRRVTLKLLLDGKMSNAVAYRMMKGSRDAIAWWEKRRIVFNLLVLMAGIVCIVAIKLIGNHFKPGEVIFRPINFLIGVPFYALVANVCYTFGWIAELAWGWGDTSATEALRPKMYRIGVIFWIALTLLPAVLFSFYAI
jgi:hypothetical protein